jgi:hypothetical protein
LIGLWVGALFVLGSACLLAAYVADGRAEQGYVATATGLRIGRAAGPLSLVLTAVLLALGLRAYQRTIAASAGTARPRRNAAATLPQQHAIWGRFRRGFLTMLAVFFLDTVVGLGAVSGIRQPRRDAVHLRGSNVRVVWRGPVATGDDLAEPVRRGRSVNSQHGGSSAG